jgi:hypothetical protein
MPPPPSPSPRVSDTTMLPPVSGNTPARAVRPRPVSRLDPVDVADTPAARAKQRAAANRKGKGSVRGPSMSSDMSASSRVSRKRSRREDDDENEDQVEEPPSSPSRGVSCGSQVDASPTRRVVEVLVPPPPRAVRSFLSVLITN